MGFGWQNVIFNFGEPDGKEKTKIMIRLQTILVILVFSVGGSACVKTEAKSNGYTWQNVTAKADYPTGYNYPVYIVDGKMLALNNGGWFSADGKSWTKSPCRKAV